MLDIYFTWSLIYRMTHKLETEPFFLEKIRTTAVAAAIGLIASSTLVSSEPPIENEPINEITDAQPLNVITIVVDDMNDFSCRETPQYLPKSSKWFLERGVCYENATTTSPVCCPARSIIQTGQLAHNNGVLKQSDAGNLQIEHTLQHNLRSAGVTTYGTGKFLNSVNIQKIATDENDIGFLHHDFWSDYDYHNFETVDDEGNVNIAQDTHTTRATGENIISFIENDTVANQPFYVYAAFYAPHNQRRQGGPESVFPQPTEQNAEAEVPEFVYQPETDVTDKLAIFNDEHGNEAYLSALHQARVRALYDVDDQIFQIFQTLETKGLDDNTAVFFMSDNGYMLGEHNWKGKAVPYNGSINVPMMAYVPIQSVSDHVDFREVGLVDIAPTIYDLYDINPTYTVDGHSLLNSYARQTGQFYEFANDDSRVVKRESGAATLFVPSWQMYKEGNEAYIEYHDEDGSVIAQEFYDSSDQLENLLYTDFRDRRPSAEKLERFKQALYKARTCAGTLESNAENPCS